MRPRRNTRPFKLCCLLAALFITLLAVSLTCADGHGGGSHVSARFVNPIPIGVTARLSGRNDANLARVVSRLRSSGVTYVKEDVSWRTLEPAKGVYDWSSMDRWVAAAARGGLRVIALPWDAPRWATPAWNVAPVNGGRIAAFAAFVRQLVQRYGSSGEFWRENPTLNRVPIRYYDIWSEPYVPRFWGGRFPDPAGYARMFKTVVEAARPADRSARFLLQADTRAFATGYPGRPFLAAILRAVPDLGRYAYALSVHPYQGDGASPRECTRSRRSREVRHEWQATVLDFCRITDIRHILDAHGDRRVRIWITEVGWSSAPRARNSVSEQTQARYVHQVFDLLRTRYQGIASGLLWYEYQSSDAKPANQEDYFGLVGPGGRPKPAWHAFVREAERGL